MLIRDMKDGILLCHTVFGLSGPKFKERLLRDKDATLSKAVDDSHAAEMTKIQLSKMADGNKSSISIVHQVNSSNRKFHSDN